MSQYAPGDKLSIRSKSFSIHFGLCSPCGRSAARSACATLFCMDMTTLLCLFPVVIAVGVVWGVLALRTFDRIYGGMFARWFGNRRDDYGDEEDER